MSDPQQTPWPDNPNAPQISYYLYFEEKAYISGTFISSILYGMIIMLFFKCMAALFNPAHRRGERIKWGLVYYTVVMFLSSTIQNAMDLNLQSISFIDNREFLGDCVHPPGLLGHGDICVYPPGPLGYQSSISSGALDVVPNVMFSLGNWLVDGLLLYRCYVIYSKKIWVIAIPCLMYLGSVVLGIMIVYQNAVQLNNMWAGVPYYSVSVALNVLLTLMIVIRLILHTRNTRTALGVAGIGRLCKVIVTMLVESCAIYAVSSLLVIGPWAARENPIVNFFTFILPETQVIAPLLVIQRVANKSALKSNTVVSGRLSSFEARTRGELTDGSGALPGGDPTSSVDRHGVSSGEPRSEVETTTDSHRNTQGLEASEI